MASACRPIMATFEGSHGPEDEVMRDLSHALDPMNAGRMVR